MFENYPWYDKLPKEELEVCEENLELFFETMEERQNVWKKRFIDKQSAPWTNNTILRDYKFTNVYRDLDNHSQWQIKNIILDDKLSLKDYIWKIMVFRYFNQPLTFEYAKITYGWRNGIPSYDQYNEDEFAEMIQGVRDSGGNPFTNAYLINSMAAPGKTRDYCYTRLVIPHLHKNLVNLIRIIVSAKKPEEIITYLNTFPSVSDFIAHEFYQDLTYIAKYTDRKIMKFDQNDFTNVGPGASLGIRLIFPSLKGKEQKQAIYYLKELAEDYLSNKMNYLHWDKKTCKYEITNKCNITLHQIEMWLCEFQKYWKMSIGEGKQRSKFKPRTKNE
jgi:hypothetical protein